MVAAGFKVIQILGFGTGKLAAAGAVLDSSPGILKGMYVTQIGGADKDDDRLQFRDGTTNSASKLMTLIRVETVHEAPYENLNIKYDQLFCKPTWGTDTKAEITLTTYKGE